MGKPRHATMDDAAEVARLLHDFNVEFATPTPPVDELTTRLRSLLGRDDFVVLLGNHADTAVAVLTLRPSPWSDGPIALLEELYVRPALRRAGIGSRLLDAAIDHAVGRGSEELQINVDEPDTDARRFYERHGFTNVDDGGRMLFYFRQLGR